LPQQQAESSKLTSCSERPSEKPPWVRLVELSELLSVNDLVMTKDGCRFSGKVIKDMEDEVMIVTKYGIMTIPVDEMLYARWVGTERDYGLYYRDVIKTEDGRKLVGLIYRKTDSELVIETKDGGQEVRLDDVVYLYRDFRRVQREKAESPAEFPPSQYTGSMALRWLHYHQNRRKAQDKNGAWDVDGYNSLCKNGKCENAPIVSPHFDVAVTGLSLLAFLGNGHTHRVGQFKKTVKTALQWLQDQQDKDGWLGRTEKTKKWIYNHAIGTMALCEAYAVTRDYRLKEPCKKAVKCIVDSQSEDGGWGPNPPDGASNTLLTSWMVLALKTAKTAGVEIPKQMFEGALKWFDSCTDPETGIVGYKKIDDPQWGGRPEEGQGELPTMTAAAVICSIFCGRKRSDPKVLKGVDVIMKNLPKDDDENLKVDMWYWYFGTYALFQYGGEKWQKWNNAMRKVLLDAQRKDGCASGSWDPKGIWWGISGGRIWASALNALTLEIYYRYQRANPGK
jgi:hypothetical protein